MQTVRVRNQVTKFEGEPNASSTTNIASPLEIFTEADVAGTSRSYQRELRWFKNLQTRPKICGGPGLGFGYSTSALRNWPRSKGLISDYCGRATCPVLRC
ncbi:hypothetical protein PoB_003128200 [Plakobranchus ocellatus]|uniref:Uncharacterized protein n=1 Tax=Plakobranchus ocellatus TaxID=259542 RepID=A0AAV4AC03_9GAST|nr:hypothetical protein PoB_003128200 [Plakobranchus ocellatus]